MDKLKDLRVVLGSQSPRRKDLLKRLGIDFEVVVFETDEYVDNNLKPHEIVLNIAQSKLAQFETNDFFEAFVITADTVVVHENKILGKPKDRDDAFHTLHCLQGSKHTVLTAVATSYRSNKYSFIEETQVEFYPLSDQEILNYIDNFSPFDKAGSYGIQEWLGLIGIKGIYGSYENVVGLPTARLYQEIKAMF